MPKRAHYFNRFGREVAAAEATRNGVLRDSFSMRVPTAFFDSRCRDARQLWDRGQLVVSDSDLTGSSGNRPGWRISDSPLNRRAIADAYRQYEDELTSAYRNPQPDTFGAYPYSPQAEGRACTINGQPGHLVRHGDWLVCRPVGELSKVSSFQPVGADAAPPRDPEEDEDDDEDEADEDEDGNGNGKRKRKRMPLGELEQMTTATDDRHMVDVHATAANHHQRMQGLYDSYAAELSQAWRGK